MKITEIVVDIIERNLDFVGDNVFQASGVTGGIAHQGILRIKTEAGIEGNCIIGQHRGDSLQKINSLKKFTSYLNNKSVFSTNDLWDFINGIPKFSINSRFSF